VKQALATCGDQYLALFGEHLFRRSAELGYAPAQFELGMAYDPTALAGIYGIPANEPVSFQWYLKAAEQGVRNAMSIVSMAYQMGIKGAPQDREKAVEWYEKLARSGDAYAMLQLGLIAIQEKQIKKGAEWLKSAAELAEPLALALYRSYVEEGVLPGPRSQRGVGTFGSSGGKRRRRCHAGPWTQIREGRRGPSRLTEGLRTASSGFEQ